MKNDINTDVIAKKKKERKITSKQLSVLSNVPVGTINKILRGETKSPQISTILALCKVLGCSVNEVLTDYTVSEDITENTEMLRDSLPGRLFAVRRAQNNAPYADALLRKSVFRRYTKKRYARA